jgi:DNA-directed RNA polymerase alpha subunit
MIRAQTDVQRVQAQNEGDMMELQTRLDIAQQQITARREERGQMIELEMLKLANAQNMSLEQIKAKLGETAIKERSKQSLFAAERRLKMQMGSGI